MIYTEKLIKDLIRARDHYSFFRTFLEHRTNPNIDLSNDLIENGDLDSTLPYLLWHALFNENRTILVGTPTYTMTVDACRRLKEIYAALPEWMCHKIILENKDCIRFENGSVIGFKSITENFGRGMTVGKLYLYEYHMVKPEIRAAVYPFWMCYPFKK